MDYENMKVTELKALARERGLRGYSWLRKAELIELLQNNQLRARDLRPPASWRSLPIPAPRPIPALRPPRPNRPPPPPPPLVRFRPDRPRQPELLRQLEERNHNHHLHLNPTS